MKAERKIKFEPVILILETQEEVDKLYAISEHTLIHNRLKLQELRYSLHPYATSGCNTYFRILQEI